MPVTPRHARPVNISTRTRSDQKKQPRQPGNGKSIQERARRPFAFVRQGVWFAEELQEVLDPAGDSVPSASSQEEES